MRVLVLALVLFGCSESIPVDESCGGFVRVYTGAADSIAVMTNGFKSGGGWSVKSEQVTVYGEVHFDWCATNGIFAYTVKVDSVTLR